MPEKKVISGKVAAILNPRELAINIGTNKGVNIDMIFRVMGESILKDPDSGEKLGSVRYEKGKVKIVKVEEKFSIARTFETYETNIGGTALVDYNAITILDEVNTKYFSPPKWVTRVQTLKYEEGDSLTPENTSNEFMYVKIGDIVEIETENKQED